MGCFKEMDPEVALRVIEGYQDVLSPAREEQTRLYSQFSCPRCRGGLNEEIDPRTAFTGSGVLPKAILRCLSCSYAIDPYTRIVVSFGDASKLPLEAIPILRR